MPFGWPVVPDEYSIGAPTDSPGRKVSGWPYVARSYDSKGPTSPSVSTMRRFVTEICVQQSQAQPHRDQTKTFYLLLSTMYDASPAVRERINGCDRDRCAPAASDLQKANVVLK